MSNERNLSGLNKAQLIEEIEQLRNSDAGKVIAELQDKVATLEAEKATADAAGTNNEEVEGLKQLVAELTERNRALEATKGNPHGLVVVDGANYQIKGGVTTKLGKFSAADLVNRPDVCAELVKMGSPMLERVNA